jgi:hypothetical protein
VQQQVRTLKSVFGTKDDANELWKNVYGCLHLYQNSHFNFNIHGSMHSSMTQEK